MKNKNRRQLPASVDELLEMLIPNRKEENEWYGEGKAPTLESLIRNEEINPEWLVKEMKSWFMGTGEVGTRKKILTVMEGLTREYRLPAITDIKLPDGKGYVPDVTYIPVLHVLAGGLDHRTDLTKLRDIYYVFAFVRRSIKALVQMVVGPGFKFDASIDLKKQIDKWWKEVSFRKVLERSAKNALIFGFFSEELLKETTFVKVDDGGVTTETKVEKIVGFKELAPWTMHIYRNYLGTIFLYVQRSTYLTSAVGTNILFKTDDVIFGNYDIVGNTNYGLGLIETIKRELDSYLQKSKDEDEIDHNTAYPRLHHKIGDPETPVSQPDFDDYIGKLSNKDAMQTDVVTPYYVDINPIDMRAARDLGPGFDRLKSDSISGLGVFPHIIGYSGERMRVSEAMARTQEDAAARFGKEIQDFLVEELIWPVMRMLKKSGQISALPDAIIPNEIDRPLFRGQIVNEFQNNLIGRKEARVKIGFDEEIPEDDVTYDAIKFEFDVLRAEMEHEMDLEMEKLSLAGQARIAKDGTQRSTKPETPTGRTPLSPIASPKQKARQDAQRSRAMKNVARRLSRIMIELDRNGGKEDGR